MIGRRAAVGALAILAAMPALGQTSPEVDLLALIRAGVFDSLEPRRTRQVLRYFQGLEHMEEVADIASDEKRRMLFEALGFLPEGDDLELYAGKRPPLRVKDLKDCAGAMAELIVRVVDVRQPVTYGARHGVNGRGGQGGSGGYGGFESIYQAGILARTAVFREDIEGLAEAVRLSHRTQVREGMQPLSEAPKALAWKYCGGGWGGYALYLFATQADRDQWAHGDGAMAIEPYLKPPTKHEPDGGFVGRAVRDSRELPLEQASPLSASLPLRNADRLPRAA